MAARNIQIRDIEPKGDAWKQATPEERRAYWTRVGEIALAVKKDEIRRGIGADGEKFMPVKPSSRPDGATGKPLDPHYAESRTVRLLGMRVAKDGVTLFWHSGISAKQKLPWATILGYHADGVVIGAYRRDTIGISPAGLHRIEDAARLWWRNKTRDRKPRKPVSEPEPEPRRLADRRVRPTVAARGAKAPRVQLRGPGGGA